MIVYQAINKVQSELAKHGLAKSQTNNFDRYQFRGIDDVYNALAPLLAKHNLVILPRVISRVCDERQSEKGKLMLYVTVEAEFDFVSSEDGSTHTVKTFGEAMDRGDKATNKAMSSAYKYAAFQAFCIPTEGDNDADASTYEVAPAKVNQGQVRALEGAINMAGADEEKWLSYYKIQAISELPAAQFEAAMTMLKQKSQKGSAA